MDSGPPDLPSASVAERWSLGHAVVILVAAAVAAELQSVAPLLGAGAVTFGVLVVLERDRWTPSGRFGAANGITAFRVGLLGLLPVGTATGPYVLIALSLLILVLDGLDGWLARRRTLSSEFGSFFDKETDALFLLLLCGLATFRGPLPVWILGAGLLRYVFVLVLFVTPSPDTTESRSTFARAVYGMMVGAVLTSFLPYPSLYRPLVAGASAALVLSFGHSLWQSLRLLQTVGDS